MPLSKNNYYYLSEEEKIPYFYQSKVSQGQSKICLASQHDELLSKKYFEQKTYLIIIWKLCINVFFTKILMLQQAVTFSADSPEENILLLQKLRHLWPLQN